MDRTCVAAGWLIDPKASRVASPAPRLVNTLGQHQVLVVFSNVTHSNVGLLEEGWIRSLRFAAVSPHYHEEWFSGWISLGDS